MKLSANVTFAALIAAAGIVRANPQGVRVAATEGVSYNTSHGLTVHSGQTCEFLDAENPPTLQVSNGATCHFDGTWDNSEPIYFTLKSGLSYLDPCGFNNGVRLNFLLLSCKRITHNESWLDRLRDACRRCGRDGPNRCPDQRHRRRLHALLRRPSRQLWRQCHLLQPTHGRTVDHGQRCSVSPRRDVGRIALDHVHPQRRSLILDTLWVPGPSPRRLRGPAGHLPGLDSLR